MKYGHFGVAILLYYTPVHPLAIQGHCICVDGILRTTKRRRKGLTVAAFVEDNDAAYAAIFPQIFYARFGRRFD